MLRRWIATIQEWILARPGRVALLSLLLVTIALALGWQVELRTTRRDLAPPGDEEQARYDRLVARMAGGSLVVACVGAADGRTLRPEELDAATDSVAAALAGSPLVAHAFHKVDIGWFAEHALQLAPAGELQAAVEALEAQAPLLEGLADIGNLAQLNHLVATTLSQAESGGSPPSPEEQRSMARGIQTLTRGLVWQAAFITDPAATVGALQQFDLMQHQAGDALPDRGYLATRNGSLRFILITPRSDDDSLPTLRALLNDLRRRAVEASRHHPGLQVAFTGEPAVTVDEMDTVRDDTWRTGAFAALGVVLLTLLVFRWKRNALLVLAALAAGLAWSFGAVYLELGYLNTITSAFISTLVGVGVAYGIHPVSEYEMEEAHSHDPVGAVRTAWHRTGTGVVVSAVTTSVAFFSILLMRFPGFAELGLVAGVGVLLCLLATMVTLPALLILHGRRRHRLERTRTRPPARRTTIVDRWWVEKGAGQVARWPRTFTAVALLLTMVAAWAATGIGFNINLLDLLPDDAESLRYQRRMILESDLSPFFNIVSAGDRHALELMAARAEQEPSIRHFDSLLPLLPDPESAAPKARRRLAEQLAGLRLPTALEPMSSAQLAGSLGHLEQILADASEDAFAAGLTLLALPLEDARAAAAEARGLAQAAGPEQMAAWQAAQAPVLDWTRQSLARLSTAAHQPPLQPDHLPESMRRRYLTADGRLLAFLQPAGDVFEPAFLESYVAASRRVSPEATGFPVVFQRMAGRITDGFRQAVVGGGLLVLLVLYLDTRSLRDTLLAALPLGMGVLWMLGAMRLLGLTYNFANLVAVPLVIGVGIDNGVHIMHRWRLEGERGMHVVLRHTGRAILIASLTTMIGFGSLALASHRGMASLGLLLLLGVGACLVTSTMVLPNLLLALGLAKR